VLALTGVAITVVAVAHGAVANAAERSASDDQVVKVRRVAEQEKTDERQIEVTIIGDQVTVHVDGEPVPEDRIRRRDGRLTIVGPDGKVIRSMLVYQPGAAYGSFSDARDAYTFFRGEQLAEPTVKPHPPVMMGVLLDEPSAALCKHLNLEPGTSTIVTTLYKGLPAHEAGLEPYDVIIEIDGSRPADPASLRTSLENKETGDTITLTVIQSGTPETINVSLTEWDDESMAEAERIGDAPQRGSFEAIFSPGEFDWSGTWTLFGEEPDIRDFVVDEQKRLFVQPPAVRQPLREYLQQVPSDLGSRMNRLDERLDQLEKRIDALLDRLSEHDGR
jgi:hypothetical protein